MAVTLEQLEIKFVAQYGGLQKQLDAVRSQLNNVNSSVAKTTSAFTGMGRMVKTFLAAYVGRAAYRVGKDSLAMANEVVESENLFSESMQQMSGQARAWSNSLRDSLGLNAFSLRKNIGTMNVMLKSMGFGSTKAYEMAEGLTMLAEDMASFYNLKPEEAFQKLQSGITGMGMPLKQLGIIVDDATLKQHAISAGISDTGKELTQQEKVLARYQAIMSQTSAAQGDLARTISSPANQLRVLSNTLDQAKVAFGEALQPLQAAVIPVLNSIASAAHAAAQAIGAFIGSLSGFSKINIFAAFAAEKSASKQGELKDSLNKTSKALKGAGGAAKKAAKDAGVGLKAFDEINKITDEATKTGGGGGGGGGGLDEVDASDTEDINKRANAYDLLSEKVKKLAEVFKRFWDGLKNSLFADVLRKAGDALKALWEGALKPLGMWMIDNSNLVVDGLMGIGAAVALWKVGTNYKQWLLALGGGLKSLGMAIAAHPVLFTIGAIGTGLILVASAIKRAKAAAVEAELDKRFGDIAYSLEELEFIAKQVKTPLTDMAEQINKDFEKLKSMTEQHLESSKDTRKLLFSYVLNPRPMTKEDMEALNTRIQEEIKAGEKLIEDTGLTVSAGITALYGEGEEGSKQLASFLNDWEKVKAQYAAKAKELQTAMTDILASDMPESEKMKAIMKLQQELTEIAAAVSPDRIKAELDLAKITYDFKEGRMNAASVKNFDAALSKQKEALIKADTMVVDAVFTARIAMARQAGATEAEIKKIEDEYVRKLNEVRINAEIEVEKVRIEGVVGAIAHSFDDQLKESQKVVKTLGTDWKKKAMEQLLANGWTTDGINTEQGQQVLTQTMNDLATAAFEDLKLPDDAVRGALDEMLASLEPNVATWQRIADEHKKQGKAVPENIAQALASYEALSLMTKGGQTILDALLNALNGDASALELLGLSYVTDLSEGVKSGEPMLTQIGNSSGSALMNELRAALEERSLSKKDYDLIVGQASVAGSLTELEGRLREGGHESAANFIAAMLNMKDPSWNAGKDLAESGEKGARSVNTSGAGDNFVSGFIGKITSGNALTNAFNAAVSFAGKALAGLAKGIKSASPSKATAQLGEYFNQGFINSLWDGGDDVKPAAANLGRMAINALSDAQADAMGALPMSLNTRGAISVDTDSGVSTAITQGIAKGVAEVMERLDITLVVDGEKLGRASIRTINDMQRRAGRTLLNVT